MHTLLRMQDLSAEQIAELLEQQGQKVPPSLVPELKLFIDEIDRIVHANPAFELSDERDAAA